MSQPERISEILKRKDYQHLNSPRLKPTPDLFAEPAPMTPDELAEARALYDYEEQLKALQQKRGYQ